MAAFLSIPPEQKQRKPQTVITLMSLDIPYYIIIVHYYAISSYNNVYAHKTEIYIQYI